VKNGEGIRAVTTFSGETSGSAMAQVAGGEDKKNRACQTEGSRKNLKESFTRKSRIREQRRLDQYKKRKGGHAEKRSSPHV